MADKLTPDEIEQAVIAGIVALMNAGKPVGPGWPMTYKRREHEGFVVDNVRVTAEQVDKAKKQLREGT
jgi:hypothetical protein